MSTRAMSRGDLPEYVGDITYEDESRHWELADQRIVGTITIGRGCSHYELRNLYVTGRIRILGSNWHAGAERVWVESAPGIGWEIGEMAAVGNALSFRQCFARQAAGLGWYLVAQRAITLEGCSADQCQGGGFLLNSAHGRYSLTAESNQGIPIRIYDCRGDLQWLIEPRVEPVIDGGSQVTELMV